MAITIIKQPAEIALSRNPNWWGFRTNNLYSNPGTKSIVILSFPAGPLVDGTTFNLTYNGELRNFIIKNYPDDSGLQIRSGKNHPLIADLTLLQWCNQFIADLSLNYYISRDYLIELELTGVDPRVKITAKAADPKYNLEISAVPGINLISISIGVAKARHPNFGLCLQLLVRNAENTAYDTVIQSQMLDVDDNGDAYYNISQTLTQSLVGKTMDLEQPDPAAPAVQRNIKSCRKYYVRIAESYGSKQTIRKITDTSVKWSLLGGSGKAEEENYSIPGKFLVSGKHNFLKQEALTKDVTKKQCEWLSLVWLQDPVAKLKLHVKAYFTSGVPAEFDAYTEATIAKYDKLTFPAGPTQLNLYGLYPDKIVSHYEVWLNDDTGSRPFPNGVAAVASTVGGTLAAGSYFYKIAAIDQYGETLASAEVSAATTGTTSSIAVSWTAVPGASSYRIYRGTVTNGQNTYFTSSVANFTDTGAAGTAGTVPPVNPAYPIRVSEIRTYQLKYDYQPYARWFGCLSSLGCYDTFYTIGAGSTEYDLITQKASITKGPNFKFEDGEVLEFESELYETSVVLSGFIRTKRELKRFRDLFLSWNKFEIKNNRAFPIMLNSKSIKERKDQDNLFYLEFETGYRFEERSWTEDVEDTSPGLSLNVSEFWPPVSVPTPTDFDHLYYRKTETKNNTEIANLITGVLNTEATNHAAQQALIVALQNGMVGKSNTDHLHDTRYLKLTDHSAFADAVGAALYYKGLFDPSYSVDPADVTVLPGYRLKDVVDYAGSFWRSLYGDNINLNIAVPGTDATKWEKIIDSKIPFLVAAAAVIDWQSSNIPGKTYKWAQKYGNDIPGIAGTWWYNGAAWELAPDPSITLTYAGDLLTSVAIASALYPIKINFS